MKILIGHEAVDAMQKASEKSRDGEVIVDVYPMSTRMEVSYIDESTGALTKLSAHPLLNA